MINKIKIKIMKRMMVSNNLSLMKKLLIIYMNRTMNQMIGQENTTKINQINSLMKKIIILKNYKMIKNKKNKNYHKQNIYLKNKK